MVAIDLDMKRKNLDGLTGGTSLSDQVLKLSEQAEKTKSDTDTTLKDFYALIQRTEEEIATINSTF